ncbi:unnamed protein product, partial [Meganyctiphanes norvegica]
GNTLGEDFEETRAAARSSSVVSAVQQSGGALSEGDLTHTLASDQRHGHQHRSTSNQHRDVLSRGHQKADCNNNDIAKCVGKLEVLTHKDIGIAASVEELNSMCPVLLDGLRCIDNYTLRCLSHQHRAYFNKLYAGTIRVIKDLCNTKGSYQQEYIHHAPCMQQVNAQYNQCSDVYHKKTASLYQGGEDVQELSDVEKNKNVITLCCSFQEYLQCSEKVVFESCGNETAAFTKDFLDRMAGPIVQSKCHHYTPGSHMCDVSSGATTQVSLMLLLPALLVVLQRAEVF